MKIFSHVALTSLGYTQTNTHFHSNLLCTWFWHILYSANMDSQLSNDFIRGKRFKSRNAFHLSNQQKANCKARLKSRNVPLNVSPRNKFIAVFSSLFGVIFNDQTVHLLSANPGKSVDFMDASLISPDLFVKIPRFFPFKGSIWSGRFIQHRLRNWILTDTLNRPSLEHLRE